MSPSGRPESPSSPRFFGADGVGASSAIAARVYPPRRRSGRSAGEWPQHEAWLPRRFEPGAVRRRGKEDTAGRREVRTALRGESNSRRSSRLCACPELAPLTLLDLFDRVPLRSAVTGAATPERRKSRAISDVFRAGKSPAKLDFRRGFFSDLRRKRCQRSQRLLKAFHGDHADVARKLACLLRVIPSRDEGRRRPSPSGPRPPSASHRRSGGRCRRARAPVAATT